MCLSVTDTYHISLLEDSLQLACKPECMTCISWRYTVIVYFPNIITDYFCFIITCKVKCILYKYFAENWRFWMGVVLQWSECGCYLSYLTFLPWQSSVYLCIILIAWLLWQQKPSRRQLSVHKTSLKRLLKGQCQRRRMLPILMKICLQCLKRRFVEFCVI